MNAENIRQEIELLKVDVKEKQFTLREAESNLRQKKHELAVFICPFKVGDRVVDTYTYEEFFIARIITSNYYNSEYGFTVFKIKKDGQPYSKETRLWGRVDHFELVEPNAKP